MTKLFVTPENVDKFNATLRKHGYPTDVRFSSDNKYQFGNINTINKYANVKYDSSNGLHLWVSGTWLVDVEEVEQFAREVLDSKMLFKQLVKVLSDDKIILERGIKCPACSELQSFGDWYGTSSDDFANCPKCGNTFTYDELFESADSDEVKKHIRELQQG